MEIVIASTNLHKIREIREMCKQLKNIDFLSLLNFPDYVQIEESGDTLEKNAILKAVDAAEKLNKWTIADDSGLFVPVLDGAPGVRSRRYASEDANDTENRQRLLQALEGMAEYKRSAYYECSLVLASPEGVKKNVTGRCEGYITDTERGRNGFGYDSIFMKNEYNKTFAELEESVKNQISHRMKALQKLIPTLESLSLQNDQQGSNNN
ncbi:MAG: RdgB/HAM1 family non-canonical purine NTP pyrophosphatase [Parachlamydiaceae bacterium]|nr:RdgB/HAM1 family non-canonical purine NTP pyrophosphatase [Parachlamydiaceae bacterium]